VGFSVLDLRPESDMKNTKKKPQRVPARFGRETQFQLAPKFAPLKSQQIQAVFQGLKTRLLQGVLDDAPDAATGRQLRLAANEAAAVSWTTPFPLLVLPTLIEEKAAEVHQYAARQAQVQEATELLIGRPG
jgi:hypothetical protein